jgi:hypothetical protein
VSRLLRALALVVAALTCLVLTAVPAVASVDGNPGGSPHPNPGGGGSQSQAGDPAQTTVKSCSLYATASSFGLSCITGSGGATTTVKQVLGKDKPPTCWDERISDADLANKYGYVQNPDAPYYLHTCLSGLDVDKSLYYQPNLQINQWVIEIPIGAKPCKQPFTDAEVGTCVMWLTRNQQKIVSATTGQVAQIPGITITTQPSTRVRSNEAVAYVDAATAAGGHRDYTPKYQVGAVAMWAQMTGFKIYPYGPDGQSLACEGTASVSRTDTPQTKPAACWWTYDQSSAQQPGQVYPFRAEADWTVYYQVLGGAPVRFASFQKYDDLKLPVYDIQTLVIR